MYTPEPRPLPVDSYQASRLLALVMEAVRYSSA